MAITSIGYGGSVDELGWANLTAQFGSEYSVVGTNDFQVSGAATPARSVVVAPGAAYGNGVYDVSDQAEVLTAAPLGSGTRWDTVVLRRDWQGPGGQTSLALLPGGTGRSISNQRQVDPGVTCDQPIALVQFSASAAVPQAIVDLRVWGGDGGLVGRTDEVRQYLTRPGTSININGTNWVREFNSNGAPTWTDMGAQFVRQEPVTTLQPSSVFSGTSRLYRTGDLMHFRANVTRTGGDYNSTNWTRIYTIPQAYRPSVAHAVTGVRLRGANTHIYPVQLLTNGYVQIRRAVDGRALNNGARIYFEMTWRL